MGLALHHPDTAYLYVMGAGTGAGKSTVCLGLLAHCLASGMAAHQLAYIKPVTQCLIKQPVALFCEKYGIACMDIGPLIFKRGFSRAFIDGNTPSSAELLSDVLNAIHTLSTHKTLVIIDGVGHPAVGSVVGVSNTDVATALSDCKVIFIGPPGIGAAIDNTVLCLSYLNASGCDSIGVIFNNLPLNSLADCTDYISRRLPAVLPTTTLLGFIPAIPENISAHPPKTWETVARWFSTYVDPGRLQTWLKLTAPNHTV